MRLADRVSIADLESHPGVCRLVSNTLLAQKRYAEAEVVTGAKIRSWAMSVPADTLGYWFVQGCYGIEELEALLDLNLR